MRRFSDSMVTRFLSPFLYKGRIDAVLLSICTLISALVVSNAVLQNPYNGYDAHDHIRYIESLSAKWQLPTKVQTGQYYSPPLPYILPALLVAAQVGLWKALRLAQVLNALMAMGVIYYLLKICDLIAPENRYLKIVSVVMLGILPVFYRSFAFVRGEPFVAFLGVYIVYTSGLIFLKHQYTILNALMLGTALGAAILARQWGFFFFPPILIFAFWLSSHKNQPRIQPVVIALLTLVFALLVGGWFYFLIYKQYGTVTPFDRVPGELSVQRLSTLFSFDQSSLMLFTDPVRPSLSGRLFPIFYADTWGDYWGYFLIFARHLSTGEYDDGILFQHLTRTTHLPAEMVTNRFSINVYLGMVNLMALIPSVLFLGGLLYGLFVLFRFLTGSLTDDLNSMTALIAMMAGACLLGFGWFLIRYQSTAQGGDLVKATYLLQAFPFFALLAGIFMERIRTRWPKAWTVMLLLVSAVFVFNLPAMITRYVLFR